MRLILSTIGSKFEKSPRHDYTMKVSSFGIGAGDPFPREEADCKTLADVRAAVAAYGAKVAAAKPDWSFDIYLRPAKGERKMRGFDAAEASGDKLGTEAWIKTVQAA